MSNYQYCWSYWRLFEHLGPSHRNPARFSMRPDLEENISSKFYYRIVSTSLFSNLFPILLFCAYLHYLHCSCSQKRHFLSEINNLCSFLQIFKPRVNNMIYKIDNMESGQLMIICFQFQSFSFRHRMAAPLAAVTSILWSSSFFSVGFIDPSLMLVGDYISCTKKAH